MKDTAFRPSTAQLRRLAKSYKAAKDKKNLEETPIIYMKYPLDGPGCYAAPEGGLFSTARDVSRFCQMLLNGGTLDGKTYLTKESVRQMTTKQTGSKVAAPYGFGLFSSSDGQSFGHNGAYKTNMQIDHGQIRVFMVQQASAWSRGDPNKEFDAEARKMKTKNSPGKLPQIKQ